MAYRAARPFTKGRASLFDTIYDTINKTLGGKLSFKDMNKKELEVVLDRASTFFGFDRPEYTSKADVLALLKDEGVTWNQYYKFCVPDDEKTSNVVTSDQVDANREADKVVISEETKVLAVDENEPLAPEKVSEPVDDEELIRLTSQSASFSVRGYKFTWDAPFKLVKKADAEVILNRYPENFRQAFPKEVEEYYS